jgi:hypothetical protein
MGGIKPADPDHEERNSQSLAAIAKARNIPPDDPESFVGISLSLLAAEAQQSDDQLCCSGMKLSSKRWLRIRSCVRLTLETTCLAWALP